MEKNICIYYKTQKCNGEKCDRCPRQKELNDIEIACQFFSVKNVDISPFSEVDAISISSSPLRPTRATTNMSFEF